MAATTSFLFAQTGLALRQRLLGLLAFEHLGQTGRLAQ